MFLWYITSRLYVKGVTFKQNSNIVSANIQKMESVLWNMNFTGL